MARKRRKEETPEDSGEATSAEATPELLITRVCSLVEDSGVCPFEQWLFGLRDRTAQARVVNRLSRITSSGNFGDHRERIAGPVSELRIDYGPGYRIYYVRHGSVLVILLAGGTKSSQERDIQEAQDLWERNKGDVEGHSRDFGSPVA